MRIVKNRIGLDELKQMAHDRFGDLVKAVVDIKRKIMVVDAELHSDQEALLLEQGSRQENLWGINLYPEVEGEGFIEFDSMINLRPSFGNRSRDVDDEKIRAEIIKLVHKLVQR